MKKELIIIALIGVLFLLAFGSIIASVAFYKEYKERIDYLDQQAQAGKSQAEAIETKLDNFKAAVDDISSQVKTYSDNIKTIQNTITLSEDERKSLLANLEDMKKNIVGMQKEYSSTVIDLRQSMITLKDELEKMGNKAKEIELGKITVKQADVKAASNEKAKDNKQPAASTNKPGGSNFKSGNVRKASSF